MDILTLSHVSKKFGKSEIIRDLSFTVPEHTIYGFIGQNGAGKTTTMKMILGLLPIDSGTITVNGANVSYGQNKTNSCIGYLPDVPEFYGYMTPMEYLNLCGKVTNMSADCTSRKSKELLDLVGLKDTAKRIHSFSRGMKQRLGIAQALLHSPRLLLCDEPTSALDPLGRKEILDILISVKEYTTILFSTHILSDVERICDEIALLHKGEIALHGTLEEMKKHRTSGGFEIAFYHAEDCNFFASRFPGNERINSTRLFFPHKAEKDMLAAMPFLAENNLRVQSIEMKEATLENLFMEVIGK